MTCHKLNLGGVMVIACSRGRGSKPKRCATCKASTDLLCDGCDRPVCAPCSVAPVSSQDFCPECFKPAWQQWLSNCRAMSRLVSPVQAERRIAFRAWVKANAARFASLVVMTRAGRAAAGGDQ